MEEETQEPKSKVYNNNSQQKTSGRRRRLKMPNHHFHNGFYYHTIYQTYPTLLPLLPLPHLPPSLIPLQPPLLHTHPSRTTHHLWNQNLLPVRVAVFPVPQSHETTMDGGSEVDPGAVVAVRRPDIGGQDGRPISLLANHFRVEFDSEQKIFHYDVDITPRPSKEVARMIKTKLVQDNPIILNGSLPVFDGRKNLYSPIEFQNNNLDFQLYLNLPIPSSAASTAPQNQKSKLFKINIRLVSKLSGRNLINYLTTQDEKHDGAVALPQDYLQALDIVLRENALEKCIPLGRSLYSKSNSIGVTRDIGGGAIGVGGFFQSLRPTQQGLALNVDFAVTAFHESISVISFLQKRCDFLKDLSQRKTRTLSGEEKRLVEKAMKNVRVFVCHRDTDQRYRVCCLTDETTENLRFRDRDGTELKVVDYYMDVYKHDIQFRNLPCLQISRSKACYLPMELCIVCEGQKFLGKLSDDQTAKILKMGCQKPGERRKVINGVMSGDVSPACGGYASGFKLNVSREMTKLQGRVLQPPKLRFGDGGHVRDITPTRNDRQWNLQDSHVAEGTKIKRWALISFGGSPEQRFYIPRFISQLSHRCEKLGIHLDRNTVIPPLYDHIQVLNNVSVLEAKLRKLHDAAAGNLQLLICVMEKKHRGYGDFKRIAETGIGVVSQCCLYSNLSKLGSQFLVNLALKINAKAGGSNVVLYNALPVQIPRLFSDDHPVIFMGADVTHPHPLDDCSPSVAAVVGSMNWPAANKYISRMRSQTHRQEIIQDLEEMVRELLEDFYQSVHKLPGRILFFRDGVSETQFHKVLEKELQAIRSGCSKFGGGSYKPTITFIVVQKRHHTKLFQSDDKSGRFSDENVPPGTVVDSVITHPTEFDFYLCSHWGMKGTSRPTHYHVLRDDNNFKSDEIQKIIHSLCYTFARCTKPVSLVPPAYYAHLAAYRGRLYLERSGESHRSNTLSRSGPPTHTTPLPKLQDNLKNLMFYC
ncbi:Protein argonaute 7 [Zostera marina]|uniref:Protein argonaute 7 n=1 Tax=Zostera marina TaxID=29655 RepID=A0A0K9NVA8_ZOSMR|nr:Protein argonaute 7 [Zostera marina]